MSTDPDRLEHSLERCLERRGAQRFEMHLPLAVHFDERTVPGFTQDLSGRGMFFYADAALPEGAVVELTFTMPSEITLGENMPVRCRGRVLRASSFQTTFKTMFQTIRICAHRSSFPDPTLSRPGEPQLYRGSHREGSSKWVVGQFHAMQPAKP